MIKIFKEYNRKQLKNSWVLYMFIAISITISTGLAISVNQTLYTMETSVKTQAQEINGADLKVVNNNTDVKTEVELDKLRKLGTVKDYTKISMLNSSINYGKNRIYCNLLEGKYEMLSSSQAIISASLSKKLSIRKGDEITISGKKYKIAKIESLPFGVNEQSQNMGYVKVNSYTGNDFVYGNIYLVNIVNKKDIDLVKSRIAMLDNESSITTASDEIKIYNDKINLSASMFGAINTLCFLLTLFSIFSTILMLIDVRSKDFASMRLNGIATKSIVRATCLELLLVIVPSTAVGAMLSSFFSRMFLMVSGLNVANMAKLDTVIIGAVYFIAVYFLITWMIISLIKDKEPINYSKNIKTGWMHKSKLLIKITPVILIILFVYSVYVGRISAFISSMIILVIITIIYILCRILLVLTRPLKFISRVALYVSGRIKEQSADIALIITALTFTSVFIIISYFAPATLSKAYKAELNNSLPYNYMAISNDDQQESNLKERNIKYSKFYVNYNMYYLDANKKKSITIAKIDLEDYKLHFKIAEGHDLNNSETGVLISKEFAKSNNIKVGSKFKTINVNGQVSEDTVSGIYISKNINNNMIIKNSTEVSNSSDAILYLIKAKNDNFINKFSNLTVISLEDINSGITSILIGYTKMIKMMSIICAILGLIFSINITWLSIRKDYVRNAIIFYLGLGKSFLIKAAMLEEIMVIVIILILSNLTVRNVEGAIAHNILGIGAKFEPSGTGIIIMLNILLITAIYSKRYNDILRKSEDITYLNIEE